MYYRFQYSRLWRDKLEIKIDFPVAGMDLTDFVVGGKDTSLIYDLYAVSVYFALPFVCTNLPSP